MLVKGTTGASQVTLTQTKEGITTSCIHEISQDLSASPCISLLRYEADSQSIMPGPCLNLNHISPYRDSRYKDYNDSWPWDGLIFIKPILWLARRHFNIVTAATRGLRELNYWWVCALPGFLIHPTLDHWVDHCHPKYLCLWCHVYRYQNYKMLVWIHPKYHAWITTCPHALRFVKQLSSVESCFRVGGVDH